MKFLTCITLSCCLLLIKMPAWAQDLNLVFPTPPMQSQPWVPLATNLPIALQNSVNILFQTGLADPRSCDYREIEVVAGNLWTASGKIIKTHGWVIPTTNGTYSNFAIGWNGLIYQLVSVGNPKNAENDAYAMIQATAGHDLHGQAFVTEDYGLNTQWLTPLKAVIILRFASAKLANECARTLGHDDPFLMLATDRLWTVFDRTTCAHARGDDELAYATATNLEQACKICEIEAKARGFEF